MDLVQVSQLAGASAVLHNIAILRNDVYDPRETCWRMTNQMCPRMMALKMG